MTWPSLLSTLEATLAAWPSSSGPNQNSSQANSATSSFISTTNLAVTCHRGACGGPPIGPLHQPPLLLNFMKPRTGHRSSETGPPRSYTSAIRVWTMTWLPSWLPRGTSVFFLAHFDTSNIKASEGLAYLPIYLPNLR